MVGKKDSVNVKSVNIPCAWFWVDGVSLPPHILISRHTKPEVVSRAEWTPHEGCLCPLWLWYRNLLTLQPWPANSNVSPRRCQGKRAGDTDIRPFSFTTVFVFLCVLVCKCLCLCLCWLVWIVGLSFGLGVWVCCVEAWESLIGLPCS